MLTWGAVRRTSASARDGSACDRHSLTAVGDDQVADFVLAFLNREGVETRFIPRKPGRRTSAVIMAIQPPDRFPLTFYREGCADRELTTEDVERAPVAESAIVLVTGTGLSHEPSRSATMHAAQSAAAAPAPRCSSTSTTVPTSGPRALPSPPPMQQLMRHAALVIGTEEEFGGRRRQRRRRGRDSNAAEGDGCALGLETRRARCHAVPERYDNGCRSRFGSRS